MPAADDAGMTSANTSAQTAIAFIQNMLVREVRFCITDSPRRCAVALHTPLVGSRTAVIALQPVDSPTSPPFACRAFSCFWSDSPLAGKEYAGPRFRYTGGEFRFEQILVRSWL
jgi:hypothetical protein